MSSDTTQAPGSIGGLAHLRSADFFDAAEHPQLLVRGRLVRSGPA